MALIDTLNRIFREFRRYTGDGLPGEPVNAPLPVGDPQSGVQSPKKSEIRNGLIEFAGEVEDFAERAEAAAAEAEAALSSVAATSFPTMATAQLYSPDVAPEFLRLEGYTAAGDGGGALYKKVGTEPTHAGKFSITAGGAAVWYELAEPEIAVEMLGASSTATAAANFTAIDAARSLANSRGLPLVFGPGPYNFSQTINFTGNDIIFWNNTVLMKQFDGVGVAFKGGSAVIHTHGNMLCQKGSGGSGPAGSGGSPANTIAGTAVGDHGVWLSNRMINHGEIVSWYHHGDGIHLSDTENMNSARLGHMRPQFNGRHGFAAFGTLNNASLLTLKLRTYGNWKSGLHLDDEFYARSWFEGDISAESNAKDGVSPGIYIGRGTGDSFFKLYSEQQGGTSPEVQFGPNSEYINVIDLRPNWTVNNSTKPWSINFLQKTNLIGNTPQEGFTRAGSVTVGATRYVSKLWKGASEATIMERKIFGDGAMHFIPYAGEAAKIGFTNTGDLELFGTNKGIFLKSANGTRYRLRVSDAGALTITAVP